MALRKSDNKENTIEEVAEQTVEETIENKPVAKSKRKQEVDLQAQVPVINMSQASLYYSARKGNGFLELDSYLDTDYMTIEDLQIMKNTARGMFDKGWLYIDDEEAVEFLGLQKQMDKILLPEKLDEIFKMHPEVLSEELSKFSASIKENIYQAMKLKYKSNELSNVHVIQAIEKSLDIDSNLSVLNF